MPMYSFRCEECGSSFDVEESISEHAESKTVCPECDSENVAWVPGRFYAKTDKKS